MVGVWLGSDFFLQGDTLDLLNWKWVAITLYFGGNNFGKGFREWSVCGSAVTAESRLPSKEFPLSLSSTQPGRATPGDNKYTNKIKLQIETKLMFQSVICHSVWIGAIWPLWHNRIVLLIAICLFNYSNFWCQIDNMLLDVVDCLKYINTISILVVVIKSINQSKKTFKSKCWSFKCEVCGIRLEGNVPRFPELADHWRITQFDFNIICEIFSHIGKLNIVDSIELSSWVLLSSPQQCWWGRLRGW